MKKDVAHRFITFEQDDTATFVTSGQVVTCLVEFDR